MFKQRERRRKGVGKVVWDAGYGRKGVGKVVWDAGYGRKGVGKVVWYAGYGIKGVGKVVCELSRHVGSSPLIHSSINLSIIANSAYNPIRCTLLDIFLDFNDYSFRGGPSNYCYWQIVGGKFH